MKGKFRSLRLILTLLLTLLLASTLFVACGKSSDTAPQTSSSDSESDSSVQFVVINGWVEGYEDDYNQSTGKFTRFFSKGTELTLVKKETPDGYFFSGWYKGETLLSSDSTYTYTIQSKITVTAVFKLSTELCRLSLTGGFITGADYASDVYENGTEVSVTANPPGLGKVFTGWYGNGELLSENRIYSFKIRKNTALEARFASEPEEPGTVKHQVSVSGGYLVSGLDTSLTRGSFKDGISITAKCVEPTGKTFNFWTINGVFTSTVKDYSFVLDRDVALTANFKDSKQKYSVKVIGGSVSGKTSDGSGSYLVEAGESVTVTATATEKRFLAWEKDGTSVSSDGEYVFAPTADCVLRARFADECSFGVENGRLTLLDGEPATSAAAYPFGSELTVEPEVADGEEFVCWIDAYTGKILSSLSTYEFTIENDIAVKAVCRIADTSASKIAVTVIGGKLYSGASNISYILGDGSHYDYTAAGNPTAYFKPDSVDGKQAVVCYEYKEGQAVESFAISADGISSRALTIGYSDVLLVVGYTSSLTVTVDGGNILGVSSNTKTAAYGEEITVTPKTIQNKIFERWELDGCPVDEAEYGSGGSYTFKAYADTSIKAVYAAACTVNVTNGQIVLDGGNRTSVTVKQNSIIKVAASTIENKRFKMWRINGKDCSTDNEYTFRVTSASNVQAVFNDVTAVTTVGGTVTDGKTTPSSSASVEKGEWLTVSAVVPENHRFVGWKKDGADSSQTAATFKYISDVSTEWTAVFIELFTVTVSGGSVTEDGQPVGSTKVFDDGAECTVSASYSGEDKVFKQWLIGGVSCSTSAEYTFNVTENVTLTAEFVPFMLLTIVNGDGTGGTEVKKVPGNCEVSATAENSLRYRFSKWRKDDADGSVLSTSNPYSFVISEDTVLYAEYSYYYQIALRIREGDDAVTEDVSGYYAAGSHPLMTVENVTQSTSNLVNVLPDGYAILRWENTAGDEVVYDGSPLTGTRYRLPSAGAVADTTFTVFVVRQYTVSVEGGVIKPDDVVSAAYHSGDQVTVSAEPRNANYQVFVRWVQKGTTVTLTENRSYSFAVTADVELVAEYGMIYTQKSVTDSQESLNAEYAPTDPNYPGAKYSEYSSAETLFTFPGLSSGENAVVQGVALSPDGTRAYVTAYVYVPSNPSSSMKLVTGNSRSVLFVLDMTQEDPSSGAKGKLVKEILLRNADGTDHTGNVGGVAVTDKNVFIASSGVLYRLSIAKINAAGATVSDDSARFDETITLPVNADFCSYDAENGVLWVGETEREGAAQTAAEHHTVFGGNTYTSWTVGYTLNEDGEDGYNTANGFKTSALGGAEGATPDYVVWLGNDVRGFAVVGGKIVVSRSYGSTLSVLETSSNTSYGTAQAVANGQVTVNGVSVGVRYVVSPTSMAVPPMIEGVYGYRDATDGKYYVLTAASSAGSYNLFTSGVDPVDKCCRLEIPQA